MLIFIVILLSLFSIAYGLKWCDWFEYGFEINCFKSPYYKFGIFFEPLQEDEDDLWRFTFGLIIINVVLLFGKKTNLSNDTTA